MNFARTSSALLVAGIALGLAATSGSTACSAILDTNTAQCAADGDCGKFGAQFRCIKSACSLPGADAGGGDSGVKECTKNEECIAKLGDFSICNKTSFTCAKLLSPDCVKVLGKDNWRSDDALIIGSILPVIGPDISGGLPLENAIEVAIADFTSGAQGLPPGGGVAGRRPLAVVSCSEASNDEADDTAPIRSATHLVNSVGVPAIIGASFSGNTQRASTVTIPANVLLMSPTATSVAITALDDKGLVWRTSPSDVIQARALVGLMPQVETLTRARWKLPAPDKTRVWVLHKGDSYGKGLAEALEKGLVFNGLPALDPGNSDSFRRLDYGDPDTNDPPTSYPAKAADVTTAVQQGKPPHVVFLMGTNESIVEMLTLLEPATGGPAWANATSRPTYLFADGGLVGDLFTTINAVPDLALRESLRTRIYGSTPGTTNANYSAFQNLYSSRFTDGTGTVGGTANTYDAFYLIALAAAANGANPVTGPNLAEALKRLVKPGPQVTPGSTTINSAFQLLASGQNIDYTGASGPLDFDIATGEAISDIQLWCVPKDGTDPTKAAGGISSGVFYDSAAGTLVATPTLAVAAKTACAYP